MKKPLQSQFCRPGQTVGVLNLLSLQNGLRQGLLFFDEFWVYKFEHILSVAKRDNPTKVRFLEDCEYLAVQCIIKDLPIEKLGVSDATAQIAYKQVASTMLQALDALEKEKPPSVDLCSRVILLLNRAKEGINLIMTAENTLLRTVALIISENYYANAIPILHLPLKLPIEAKKRSDQIFDVIIKSLPIPTEDTPFEQILEFRQDERARATLSGLRDWQNEISKSSLSAREIATRLEHLVHEYESQLKLHRLKYKTGVFNTLITTSAEIIEHMSRLKFSSAANALFSIRSRKIALLEAERSTVGREVAYISLARKRFEKICF